MSTVRGSRCQAEFPIRGYQCICGAVFARRQDTSHPMKKGLTDEDACAHFPTMKRGVQVIVTLHGNHEGPCNCTSVRSSP